MLTCDDLNERFKRQPQRPAGRHVHRPPGGGSIAFFSRQEVRNQRIGVTMAHAVFSLEQGHKLHMLPGTGGLEQIQPVANGLPIVFSMEGKYDAGPFVFVSSVMMQTPFLLR